MTTRLLLAALATTLVAMEIIRPTHVPAKRIARTPASPAAGWLAQEMLDDLPPLALQPLGSIDTVSARNVALSGTIAITGWCADAETRRPGAGLFVQVDGRRRIDLSEGYRESRPDVVAYFKRRELEATGFTIRLGARSLGPGLHYVELECIAGDGRGYEALPPTLALRIGP